jgi:plasmid stability protein
MKKSQFSMLSARLPAQLHDQLARSAQAHDRSVSAEARVALREHLAAKDFPPSSSDKAGGTAAASPASAPEGQP